MNAGINDYSASSSRIRMLLTASCAVLIFNTSGLPAQTGDDDVDYKLNTGLETFGRVYREITEGYVDALDPEQMMIVGIQSMLERLDPYTTYNPNKSMDDTETLTTGSYTGIGISVRVVDSTLIITDLNDNYAAQKAGVRIGDRILTIDSANLRTSSLGTLRRYIRGKPNTSMRLTVKREGVVKPITFELKRQTVSVRSSEYNGFIDSVHSIAYIRLNRFSATAGDEVRTAIVELQRIQPLRGVILDLRGNPGGLLESAVDVASKFVPSGSPIVTTRGRDTAQSKTYRSTEEPLLTSTPLVVLVDENSASASEIVAGAIQDLDAGIILGAPSFGKGLVQTVRTLPNDATLKLTTARYYTPSGRSIQKVDYSRNRFSSDGSVFRLDSVLKEFRTKAGRSVFDHGGITPDTVVSGTDTTTITEQLRRAGAFFKFANRYTASLTHLPDRFAVDDTLLKRFEEFSESTIASANASGTLMAKIRDLREAALQERSESGVMKTIDRLQTEITDAFRQRLRKEREEIRRELFREITGRFTTQRTRLMKRLSNDRQVNAAIGLLLSGKPAYLRLLATDKLKEEN